MTIQTRMINLAILALCHYYLVSADQERSISFSRKSLHSLPLIPSKRVHSMQVPRGGDTSAEVVDSPIDPDVDTLDAAKSVLEETSPPPQEVVPTTPNPADKRKEVIDRTMKRTGPAVLMLGCVYLIIKMFGENGLIGLILLMQLGLYSETTGVISSFNKSSWKEHAIVEHGLQKWLWFATVFAYTTIRPLVFSSDRGISKASFDLMCFGLASASLITSVIGMEKSAVADERHNDALRFNLGKIAGYQYALVFLIGQSSFWIHTVQAFGIESILYPALLVVINDTMAYFFGVTMGKNKIIPRLSPKKTVEGFIGAALSTFLASVPLLKYILSYSSDDSRFRQVFQDESMNMKVALITAAYTSFVSPFGGFFASAVKRAFLCKDFGTLIPGHGGVVDRFDCQVVTAPFTFLLLKSVVSSA